MSNIDLNCSEQLRMSCILDFDGSFYARSVTLVSWAVMVPGDCYGLN